MTDPTTVKNETPTEPTKPESLARRSMLLKSVGKGSAVLAAASLPVHTLSNTPTIVIAGNTSTRCSISGMQSGLGSRIPATDTCAGKSPGYWHKDDHWIQSQKNVIFAEPRPTFNSWFGATTSTVGHHTLYEFLTSTGRGENSHLTINNTPEWHWIGAWMNAMANNVAGTGVRNFPYTAPQVVAMYQDPGAFNTTRDKAVEFFSLLEL